MRDRSKFKVYFNEPSKTKQSFKDETDVNKIMAKFKKVVGVEYLSRFNAYMGGQFGDFSQVVDYRTALEQIAHARDLFGALPAIVRKRFDNDAAVFLDFVQNPANAKELVEMGLAQARPVDSGQKTGEGQKPVSAAG